MDRTTRDVSLEEACEHIIEIIAVAKKNRFVFWGCDCTQVSIECKICNIQLLEINEILNEPEIICSDGTGGY